VPVKIRVNVLYKNPTVLVIVKSSKKLSVIEKTKCLRNRENIHCYLRNEYFVAVNQFES